MRYKLNVILPPQAEQPFVGMTIGEAERWINNHTEEWRDGCGWELHKVDLLPNGGTFVVLTEASN